MDPAPPAINEHMSSAELFGPVLHRYLGSSALSVIQGHQLARRSSFSRGFSVLLGRKGLSSSKVRKNRYLSPFLQRYLSPSCPRSRPWVPRALPFLQRYLSPSCPLRSADDDAKEPSADPLRVWLTT